MKAFRFLTSEDTSEFCHKVTKALALGWELYGHPQFTYDAKEGKRFCGQAVVKEVEGEYSPDLKLGEL